MTSWNRKQGGNKYMLNPLSGGASPWRHHGQSLADRSRFFFRPLLFITMAVIRLHTFLPPAIISLEEWNFAVGANLLCVL